MTMAFPCENCGYRFEIDAGLAGKKGKCKSCGHVFVIPTTRPQSASNTTTPAPSKSRPVSPPVHQAPPSPAPASFPDDDHPRPAPLPRWRPNQVDAYDVAPPRARASASVDDDVPRPARPARKRWGYNGEPWAIGLRAAAVFFTAAGVAGYIVFALAMAFLIQEIKPEDLKLGKIPSGTGGMMVVGLVSILSFISLAIGVFLTFLSFLGTTISFATGNRRAFGGDDILLMIGWYGSGVVMLVLTAFFGSVVLYIARGGPNLAPLKPPLVMPNWNEPGKPVKPFVKPAEPSPAPPVAGLDQNDSPPPVEAPPIRSRPPRRVGGPPPGFGQPPVVARLPVPLSGAARTGAAFVAQALSDLRSPQPQRQRGALARLKDAPADEARKAEVAEAVEPFLRDPESGPRVDAAKTLAFWGSRENTPALVQTLNDPVIWVRWAVLDALTELKDPAAAEAVAARLADTRDKASKALRAMGPDAEPAVLPYLTHSDLWIRTEACKILGDIGHSEECKVALVNVVRRTNNFGFEADAARAALQKIGMPSPALRKKSIIPGVRRR